MRLWFDQRMRTHLEFEKSPRCHTLRHERDDARGCDGWFRSIGTGRRICLCRCHSEAITRRVTANPKPPLDLRQYVGGVTAAEAVENMRAGFALMPKLPDTRIARIAALSGLDAGEIERLGGVGDD